MADDTNNNDEHPSPDDALEPPDDIFNPTLDEERLEEDYDPPATPANPHINTPHLPPDHPAGDGNIDFQELYDEGVTSATDYDAQEEGTESIDEPFPIEPENGDEFEEPEENEGRERP